MAALMNNQNDWMNNPFAYIMFLALFRGGFGGGWGDGNGSGVQGAEIQARLNSIQAQLSDNQNSGLIMDAIKGNGFAISQLSQNLNVDFNTLQKCCCDVQAAIQGVAGQVGFSAERVINAAQLGDQAILSKLCECCCQTQRQIADFRADVQLQNCEQTNTLQRGQDFINRTVERGFAAQGFQAQQDKCDIINAVNAAQQRTTDLLNNHWAEEQRLEIQDLKNQLAQRDQTDAIFARLYGGYGCNSNRRCGNGCGCNNTRGF